MIYFNTHPIVKKTKTATNNNNISYSGTILRFTFLFSFVVLFIATQSAMSFTHFPQTTFQRRSIRQSSDEIFNHPSPLRSTSVRKLQQQQVKLYSNNAKSINIIPTSYQQLSANFRTRLCSSNVRWGVPPRNKFIRYTSSLSSPIYSTSSSSSSMDSNTSTNSRLVTAVLTDSNNDDQIEAIQMIFSNYCDADGLMAKMDVMKVPYIADLLVRCLFDFFLWQEFCSKFVIKCNCTYSI